MGAATVKMVWVWRTGDGADLYDELKGRWLGNTSLYEMDDSPQRYPPIQWVPRICTFFRKVDPAVKGAKETGSKLKAYSSAPLTSGGGT